ncbi:MULTISPECIES: M10 family metallopeptidase C-terminal domain-containing protein [unclassified Pseudomonas]|uniref:M10 family metallopeptidase C-terminal domain-containing protein n=1 Tax=unclassified Pseudomonas TaxID=196821 RepID=UPI001C68B514|nr:MULTISPECIES: M10 family metallopeptidase C-terminal domain-containing protein [unclassified Pseudomonas]QYM67025.1 M10 family metallopeptidase C-terminal domain-containing protein [Pseudomonas sp. So3.2b]WLH55507.1 M10 family metallopeptidase C-terminal domain-containing protein [Pseudomonas sp. FP2294]
MSVPKAQPGDAGRHTLIHELGHAMGLTHPGNYNGILDRSKIDSHEDSQSHSVMSYRGEHTTYANHGGFRASAPQLDDIYAYQSKYGVNHQTRKDDTTYGFNSNTGRDFLSVNTKHDKMVAAIWDGGGNDTLDFSGYSQDQKISLEEGTFSDVDGLKGNVSIAYGATIENAKGGTGNDWLVGNAANNELRGGDGNDSSATAPDRIQDFVSGEDKVDVSGIRAQLGDKPLQFVSRFTGVSGEAIVAYDRQSNMSTLQISGKPSQPAFVLEVQGELQRSDIVS